MAKTVDSNKKKTSLLSSMLLILVPWMQISKAVKSNVAVSFAALTAVLGAGIALHLAFLAFNLTATKAMQLGKTASDDGMDLFAEFFSACYFAALWHSSHLVAFDAFGKARPHASQSICYYKHIDTSCPSGCLLG